MSAFGFPEPLLFVRRTVLESGLCKPLLWAPDSKAGQQAAALARSTEGVIYVRNDLTSDVELGSRLKEMKREGDANLLSQ
jgi:hypothetical protein